MGTHCLDDVTNESFQALIKGMLHQESIMIHMRSIGEISLSSTGARGYGQITSSVFNETRSPLNNFWVDAGGNERYIYKSRPNLECAARYLSLLYNLTYHYFPEDPFSDLTTYDRLKITMAMYNRGEYAVRQAFDRVIPIPWNLSESLKATYFNDHYQNSIETILQEDGGDSLQGYHYVNAIFNNNTTCTLSGYDGSHQGYYSFYLSYPSLPFQNIDFGRIKQ